MSNYRERGWVQAKRARPDSLVARLRTRLLGVIDEQLKELRIGLFFSSLLKFYEFLQAGDWLQPIPRYFSLGLNYVSLVDPLSSSKQVSLVWVCVHLGLSLAVLALTLAVSFQRDAVLKSVPNSFYLFLVKVLNVLSLGYKTVLPVPSLAASLYLLLGAQTSSGEKAAAVLGLAILLALWGFYAYLLVENNPFSQSCLTVGGESQLQELFKGVSKVLGVVVALLDRQLGVALYYLPFILAAYTAMLAHFWLRVWHFRLQYHRLCIALLALKVWVAFCSVLSLALPFGNSFFYIFILAVPLVIAGTDYFNVKHTTRMLYFSTQGQIIGKVRAALSTLLSQEIDNTPESHFRLKAMLLAHRSACEESMCPCNDLRDEPTATDWYYFLEEMAYLAAAQSSGRVKLQLMLLASFIADGRLSNSFKALLVLTEIQDQRLEVSHSHQLSIFKVRRSVDAKLREQNFLREEDQLVQLYEYQHKKEQFYTLTDECKQRYSAFLFEVLEERPYSRRIQEAGLRFLQSREQQVSKFDQLLKLNHRCPELLGCYGRYLQQTFIDLRLGKELCDRARCLAQTQAQQRVSSLQRYSDNSRTIIILVSSYLDTIGIISHASSTAAKLGYSVGELIGENIKILMPAVFAQQHDQTIRRFIHKSSDQYLSSQRRLPALSKQGFIVPVFIRTKLIPSPLDGLQIGGFLLDARKQPPSSAQLSFQLLVRRNDDSVHAMSENSFIQLRRAECFGGSGDHQLSLSRLLGMDIWQQLGRQSGNVVCKLRASASKQPRNKQAEFQIKVIDERLYFGNDMVLLEFWSQHEPEIVSVRVLPEQQSQMELNSVGSTKLPPEEESRGAFHLRLLGGVVLALLLLILFVQVLALVLMNRQLDHHLSVLNTTNVATNVSEQLAQSIVNCYLLNNRNSAGVREQLLQNNNILKLLEKNLQVALASQGVSQPTLPFYALGGDLISSEYNFTEALAGFVSILNLILSQQGSLSQQRKEYFEFVRLNGASFIDNGREFDLRKTLLDFSRAGVSQAYWTAALVLELLLAAGVVAVLCYQHLYGGELADSLIFEMVDIDYGQVYTLLGEEWFGALRKDNKRYSVYSQEQIFFQPSAAQIRHEQVDSHFELQSSPQPKKKEFVRRSPLQDKSLLVFITVFLLFNLFFLMVDFVYFRAEVCDDAAKLLAQFLGLQNRSILIVGLKAAVGQHIFYQDAYTRPNLTNYLENCFQQNQKFLQSSFQGYSPTFEMQLFFQMLQNQDLCQVLQLKCLQNGRYGVRNLLQQFVIKTVFENEFETMRDQLAVVLKVQQKLNTMYFKSFNQWKDNLQALATSKTALLVLWTVAVVAVVCSQTAQSLFKIAKIRQMQRLMPKEIRQFKV